jgi:hypothetical protein
MRRTHPAVEVIASGVIPNNPAMPTVRTIAELGYPGVIAHEYDPTPGRDPVRSLEKVFAITDV